MSKLLKGESAAGAKPPSGFVPIPKSTKGGYRKKMPNGGYVYWYPSESGGRGSFRTEKHREDRGKMSDVVLSILNEMLPPDKHPYIARMAELLEEAESDTAKAPGEEPEGEAPEETPEETPEGDAPEDPEEPEANKDLREELEQERKLLREAAERADMERDLQATRAAAEAFESIVPSLSDAQLAQIESAVAARFGQTTEEQAEKGGLFAAFVDELIKARATKYIRRVPTGNPKRPWRYYYAASSAAREVTEGETVKLGDIKVDIEKVEDDGTVHVRMGDQLRKYRPHEWSQLLTEHYGSVYTRSAERRARQATNAVLRHVPRSLLKDLKGDTEKERLEDLRKRAPQVYKRLKSAFSRAGMDALSARRVIADTLQAKGWDADARAALLGNVLDERGAWLATHYQRVIRSTNNSLQQGESVSAAHVQAAVDILAPGGPLEKRDKIADEASKELEKLQAMLKAAEGDPAKAVDLLRAALDSPALAQINAIHRAHPELDVPQGKESAEFINRVGSVRSRVRGTVGAPTQVYVAGANGQPIALAGEYRLVEASEAIPSHNPDTFSKNEAYPEGLQERAYHRDKSEQAKVTRNAQRMKPGFLVNTNPDALNGPPIVDEDGIVLGGNSRTMSMQRVYSDGGAKAEELRTYLRENAYQMGLRPEDVDGMKSPILVRVVNTEGQDKGVLVRAMNESFIQGMDPRTAQVAMGRRLNDKALKQLADTMEPEQTLRGYLDSKVAKPFVNELSRAGIIDDRNRNQYIDQKTGKLNEDGKTLVERILVGRLVEDPDLLSSTRPSMVSSLARAVPYMIQAEAAGQGYAIRDELRQALHGFNRMHALDAAPPRGASKAQMDQAIKVTKASLRDMFEGDHPVNTNPRVEAIFDNLVLRGGPRQIAATFRKYAEMAQRNPEGQTTLMGDAPTPASVFNQAVASVMRDEKKTEEQTALFRSMTSGARDHLDILSKRVAAKSGAPKGYMPIPGSKSGGYRKRRGKGYKYWYPDTGHASRARAHEQGDAPKGDKSKASHMLHDLKRVFSNPKALVERVGGAVVDTAHEFPHALKAARKIGKKGDKLSSHDIQALASVAVILGSAAMYAGSGGIGAAGAAVSLKLLTHVAMKAIHNRADAAYTGGSALDFVGTFMLGRGGKMSKEQRDLLLMLATEMQSVINEMSEEDIERHA